MILIKRVAKEKYYNVSFLYSFLFLIFFLFPFSFFLVSCSTSTEIPKGSLSGTIILEGETDHSEITIAIYELASLDPDIVAINQEYPHIGVIINQMTEFDHRFQSPVKYTETDIEGNFLIKKIPVGEYNIVALKDGWGFKYIYEFEIEKGENALAEQSKKEKVKSKKVNIRENKSFNLYPLSFLSRRSEAKTDNLENRTSDLTLYPEHHLSGDITDNWIFETDHHYIIGEQGTNSTNFIPDTNLEIQPGAIIRIEPENDLVIHGTISAQGEENNMFWITSNDGFSFNLFPFSFCLEDISQYNSMELSSIASISDDLIEWCKFDFANTCLLNQVNNVHLQNGIFRDSQCGFKSTNVDSTFCENLIGMNCIGDGCVSFDFIKYGRISNNIYIANNAGIDLKNDEGIRIINNFFKNNQYGVYISAFYGEISNNEFLDSNNYDIHSNGGAENNPCNFEIKRNIFNSTNTIMFFFLNNQNYVYFDYVNISRNNFYKSDLLILYWSDCFQSSIDINMNYLVNAITEEDYIERIIDENEVWENLLIRDILLIPNVGIGINEGE